MNIRVHPGAKNPTHEISLSDGVQKWGLRLDGGPAAISEVPMTASTIQFSGGGTKFGDWEPGMSHIEQRTWEGGRGQDEYVDDPTRYYDAMQAWTITPGKICPGPQWRFAEGLRNAYAHLPGNVDWGALIGPSRFLAASFEIGDEAFQIHRAYLWLRRIGSPGKLEIQLYTDDNGQPGTLVAGSLDSTDTAEITDVISQFVEFDLSGCGSLAANTRFHLVVAGAENDSGANHWEVGIDQAGEGSLASADGEDWDPTEFSMYFRAVDPPLERKWHLFRFKQALYAVDQRADGTPSRLYLNGDRGAATQGTAVSLSDSDKNWGENEWADAWVCISKGTGAGQRAQITGNSNNTLTVTGWKLSPDSSSEYVISSTPRWQEITPTTGDMIDGVVRHTAVVGDEVLLAQGLAVSILRMRWNPAASPPAHEFADDGTNSADMLIPFTDPAAGLVVWRVKASESKMSKSSVPDWGTAYSYATDLQIGFSSHPITNAVEHNGKLHVYKTDGRYTIEPDGSVEISAGGIAFLPSTNNGEALLRHGLFEYFSWGGYGLMQLYDSGYSCELTAVGPDVYGGLPPQRQGWIAALAGHPLGILAALDGSAEKSSSVLMRPDGSYGWHEVFRGWQPGVGVDSLFWQQVGAHRPRLWIGAGGELVFQDWPEGGCDPLKDEGFNYQHEAVLLTSTIDMGASRLPKLIKEFNVITKNLASGIEIHLDAQFDEEIGGQRWTNIGSYHRPPEDSLGINRGDVRKIRLRLRMLTNNSSIPPVVQATILEGYARTPLKYQWNLRVKLGDCQQDLSGDPDHDPDSFLDWLKHAARHAHAIQMGSIWEQMDGKVVVVEPPTLLRSFTNNLLGLWGGSINLTLRES
jgi:hypothetical protein